MKPTTEEIMRSNRNWFTTWFDSEFYHKLYAHRGDNEAEQFVVSLVNELQLSPPAVVLDLACGKGRHAKQFAARGFDVVGLDLSHASMREAKKYESEHLKFYSHDMREPFGKNTFDCVFSFFTSLGYFETEGENEQVLKNISSALKTNGRVVIDYLNAPFAKKSLVAREEKDIDGIVYKIKRWEDHKYIHKRIEIDGLGVNEPFVCTEKVRKLGYQEFELMFERTGLTLQKVYGDYTLSEYIPNTSPRLILLAQKI